MEIIVVLLLLLLGVLLLVVEFMLIPGITIAGIGCFLSFAASVYYSFKYWGTLAGFVTLLAVVIFVPLFLYFLFKGKAVKPMMLNTDIDGKVNVVDEEHIHVGDKGTTVGRLAPAGKVRINGVSLEARSTGAFIDEHTPVRVIKIEHSTVYVEPIKP
ncbi:MAG TPA: NfeD family protein [Prolixibacteraceae bacterium]|nr:NfeD family protein [Prolixibacteraceae bacterium]